MHRILITGANSFVGTNVERWLIKEPELFMVQTTDTKDEKWKSVDFSEYDTVLHVAGIAHVDPKPEMAPLYYKVNCDLAIEIASHAKKNGVKRFIYMSSKIVYHASKSMKTDVISKATVPKPNDFYGDSKLKAEVCLRSLEDDSFRVCILRPPMIYGLNNKGNLPRLAWLTLKSPVFPAWHNKRSMIFVDNLAEFIKQIILRDMSGTFHPQNEKYADTVEIVRYFAKKYNKKIWISSIFNPFVFLSSFFLRPICKMFSSSYYEQELSEYGFNYNVLSFEESLKDVEPKKNLN